MKTYIKKFFSFLSIDELTLNASSLSFYTIFAIIPIILILFSISTNLPILQEYYDKFTQIILSNIIPSNQDKINSYIYEFFKNTSSMGIIGFIYIFITSILFFDNYEDIIQKIYNSPKRTLIQKIKLYFYLIIIFPFILTSATFISIKIQYFLNLTTYTSYINLLAILPFFLIWLAFFIIYKVSPNIKLNNTYTLFSSLVATLIFYLAKVLFLYYTILNTTYKSIYGPFSLILFLFLWIYVSWIIFFIGLYLNKFMHNEKI